MAGKSFIIEYLIRAKSGFTEAAEKTRAAANKMKRDIRNLAASIVLSAKMTKEHIRGMGITESMVAHSKYQSARLKGDYRDLGNFISRIGANIRANNAKISKSFSKLNHAFNARNKGMRNSGIWTSIAVSAPSAWMLNDFKNNARDAIETTTKFDTIFSNVLEKAHAASADISKNFGLSSQDSKRFMGNTGDLLTGFGFNQEDALRLSTTTTKLSADLISFTNLSGGVERASNALTSALIGRRQAVKSLGIAILEQDVNLKIRKMMAEGHKFGSLRQAKAEATLAIAIEQSKNAMGDFARTQMNLANQERITSSRIKDLKVAFGDLLLPVALQLTIAVRSLAEWLNELSPTAKKTILVFAAILAILGPLLVIIGTMIIAVPVIGAAFTAFGALTLAALLPVLAIAAGIAGIAYLIIDNWDKVSDFFDGFATGISDTFGPTLSKLVDDFKLAAETVVSLFGLDSDAAKALTDFSNIGQLIGDILGRTLDLIVRSLSGIGEIIGQFIGAIATKDFSNFNIDAIKAQFIGAQATPIVNKSRVDVGVNVGLDSGLKQLSPTSVFSDGSRRPDVGLNYGG
jgi:hypothetical protein